MFRSSIPGVRLIFPPHSPPRHQNCPLWARCLWCQPTTQGWVPARGQYLPVKQNASHFRIFGNIIIILVTLCPRSSWGPTLSCTCRATWPGTGEASAGTPSPSWGRAPGASSGLLTTRQTTLRMSSARGGSKRRWTAMWRVIRVLTRVMSGQCPDPDDVYRRADPVMWWRLLWLHPRVARLDLGKILFVRDY